VTLGAPDGVGDPTDSFVTLGAPDGVGDPTDSFVTLGAPDGGKSNKQKRTADLT
jgi:hypothetical protein